MNRRLFLASAAAMGAAGAWASPSPQRSRNAAQERRDLFPEGVASGDPDSHSVFLWARRPPDSPSSPPDASHRLAVEVSEDQAFTHVIATAHTSVLAASDWTCRVLVGNLKPAHIYWYRFIDDQGNASRVGRTTTAPAETDPRTTRFAVVCCQNANLGAQHAYRRMIFEDVRAPEAEQLGFVLHLGDFIYETVWYPEDKQEVYGRRVREIVRYPHGEKVGDVHIPTTVDDYRAAYRAYLRDPDLQDARARWPFVCIWDNHEFSQAGWQSLQVFQGTTQPRQTRKVAANQAWFEYQPARVRKSSGPSLASFDAAEVSDAEIRRFDEHGMGQERNNLAALASLTGYRALRWGRHIELIVTDQRSYRSEGASGRAEAKDFWRPQFPKMIPQEVLEILDAGRAYANGNPPDTIHFDNKEIPNFRKDGSPQTILGADQKVWFLERLRHSTATWKVWGNTTGTLDRRVDPQNLPPELTAPWPGQGFAIYEDGDHGSTFVERAEIYSVVRDEKITGFVTIAGDRHSFWAGLAAPALPPKTFEPIGVAFVTASISAPSSADILDASLPHDHPLHSIFFTTPTSDTKSQPLANMLLRQGVRSCIEYASTGNKEKARQLSNHQLAPHLQFLDLAGQGFSTIKASGDVFECEFVCLPRPVESIHEQDGGPVSYRVIHRTQLWESNETPQMTQHLIDGQLPL